MGEPTDLELLAARLHPLFAAHPEIAAVYVFGSVARGQANPESDLDLGLVFRRREDTAHDHQALLAELVYEIPKLTDRQSIDLVVLPPQGPVFCHRVLLEGHRIYEGDRTRRIDFESDTYVRAFDFRPTWELATRGKASAIRHWLRTRYDLR